MMRILRNIENRILKINSMLIDCSFICVYCLQENDTVIDPSGGEYQEYVEDCQICCRPNRLKVTVSPSLDEAHIDTHPA